MGTNGDGTRNDEPCFPDVKETVRTKKSRAARMENSWKQTRGTIKVDSRARKLVREETRGRFTSVEAKAETNGEKLLEESRAW
jgi:hypothetical protein